MSAIKNVASELSKGSRILETARSLDDFLRILSPFNQRALAEIVRIKADRPSYLFRGDKADKPLVATIGRCWRNGLDTYERRMLRHLQEKYENVLRLSDWELVALARHYGVDTRFLDWSSNALVALRFALGNKDCNCDGQPVVWVLETRALDFEIPVDEVMPFPKECGSSTKIFAPSAIDSRVASQDSYMMRQVFVNDKIEPVNENETFKNRIWQLPIDKAFCKLIASQLEQLGYTFDALLPEVDWKQLRDECNIIMKGDGE